MLSQLRYYLNYCTERQYQYTGKKGKYANEQVQHYEYARNSIEQLIKDIEDVLNSGDSKKISNNEINVTQPKNYYITNQADASGTGEKEVGE